MEEMKRVEAKIILQKNEEGHWLVIDSPSGKHAMVNIENVFKGTVREALLEWPSRSWSRWSCLIDPRDRNSWR
jgi:hypothetical protein